MLSLYTQLPPQLSSIPFDFQHAFYMTQSNRTLPYNYQPNENPYLHHYNDDDDDDDDDDDSNNNNNNNLSYFFSKPHVN